MRSLRILVAVMVVLGVAGTSVSTRAAPQRKRIGAAVSPVRLIPRGGTIEVEGLHHFFGTVELRSGSDGLVVVNSLPLEKYLLGLQEVPRSWPREALRAQAVAARTFALYTIGQPPVADAATYGFDICASINCQVFSGADVLRDADGAAWQEAVESTAGQVLLFKGEPILARYHSTSGGETLDNEDAFEGDPPYPYLKGVPSPWEQAGPLFRWEVRIPLRDMQRMLGRIGWWIPANGKLVDVRTVEVEGRHYPDVVYRGRRGSFRSSTEQLRDELRDVAPSMYPDRHPSPSPTGIGTLPETFPSERFNMATRAGIVTTLGRGWGHGTGMSQWGAYGLAGEGAGYADILAHYYTDVTLGSFEGRQVDVGIDWARSSVAVTGEFDVVDGRGRRLVKHALGTWRFAYGGAGVVEVDPPKGYGLPLRVGVVEAPRTVQVGEASSLTVALSRPAKIATETLDAPTGFEDEGTQIRNGGRRQIPWLAPLEPGTYEVRVSAATAATRRVSESVTIEVVAAPLVSPDGVVVEESGGGVPLFYVAAGLAALLLITIGSASYLAGRKRLPE